MSLEKDKEIARAMEAWIALVELRLRNSNLHPDEMSQEVSYLVCGAYNRLEQIVEGMPKVKGHKPTKE